MTDCPVCGLPAAVVDTFTLPSTHGPTPHEVVLCLGDRTHRFTIPQENPS